MFSCGNSFYRYMNNPFMGGCHCNHNAFGSFFQFAFLSNMMNSMFAMQTPQMMLPQMYSMPQAFPMQSVFSYAQPYRMPAMQMPLYSLQQPAYNNFNIFNTIINKPTAVRAKRTDNLTPAAPVTSGKTQKNVNNHVASVTNERQANQVLVLKNTELVQYACQTAQKYGVDEKLVLAVIFQESGFKNCQTSKAGAQGYMQLMPATAKQYGVTDVMDPHQNIEGGVKVLKYLLDKYNGNVEAALISYNWGEGNYSKYLKGQKSMPAETQKYRNVAQSYKNVQVCA